jgi:tight adherence protein C
MRRVTPMTAMRDIVRRLDLLRNQTTAKIIERLARAGWRSKDALVIFLIAKIVMPFIVGVAGFIVFNAMAVGDLSPTLRSLLPLLAVGVGAYAPDLVLKNATQKREAKLQKGLPDALDLLVICAEAGLSLDAGLTRVANEMARGCPEIADEFGLTAVEIGFLPQRRTALEHLTNRVQLSSVRGVVNTLLQTEKYGTPLAGSLRVLSSELRNERMMKAEEKAARLPAILTVPLIVFILPTLFIVVLGPAVLRIMDNLGNF